MSKPRKRNDANDGTGLVRVSTLPLADLKPSPENAELYRPVLGTDPKVIALAASIRKHYVRQPLEVTADRYIVSGHRRHCAAKLAGLAAVPCIVLPQRRADFDDDAYVQLLRGHNHQRDKTFAERVREGAIDAGDADAYAAARADRAREADRSAAGVLVDAGHWRGRAAISDAKRPMLDVAVSVINGWRASWPVSVRRVHYALLNDPPFRFVNKRGKGRDRYTNNEKSYNDTCDLSARARIAGDVPMNAIDDETRPVMSWRTFAGVGEYVTDELDGLLTTYWRDLMIGQPHHVEIVGEKNTVLPILKPVASRFTIPLTIGRGYMSVPPRAAMVGRYERSGKDKLILLVASDHDPEGCDIPEALARSIRDDFGIIGVEAYKVALTPGQVAELKLPRTLDAKPSSSRYAAFAERFGTAAYELEAMPPEVLAAAMTRAVEAVIDVAAFNAEAEAERIDRGRLNALRRELTAVLAEVVGRLDDDD